MSPAHDGRGADLEAGLFVDRIEGPVAVLVSSDQQSWDVLIDSLPPGVREGDWLTLTLTRDASKRAAVLQSVTERRARLLASDDGSDIVL